MLLVQVVKEERGNKGAALTTYLSLAGRYCVLMPNTSHGGGISRKISNGADRKRLKSIMCDLKLPKTMGLIVRTAGLSRTKVEIKRDFDYLARLWDEIREATLKSTAPALVYRDSDLIKRAIRDLYHREIDEVIVEGEEGYKAARGFMKLLMPSHVKRVTQHSEPTPLFQRYGAEDQLSAMYQPIVQLKSGGYLVINPTEALVSIDINSGRSTREHNIEQTAYQHQPRGRPGNRPPAAPARHGRPGRDRLHRHGTVGPCPQSRKGDEGSAQERPRADSGGTHFQLRPDGNEPPAPAYRRARSLDPAVRPLRWHRPDAHRVFGGPDAPFASSRMKRRAGAATRSCLRAGREAAVYVFNKKRAELADIEHRYGVAIDVVIDETFEGAKMTVESSGGRPVAAPRTEARRLPRTTTISKPRTRTRNRSKSPSRTRMRRKRRSGPRHRTRKATAAAAPPPPPWRARAQPPRPKAERAKSQGRARRGRAAAAEAADAAEASRGNAQAA